MFPSTSLVKFQISDSLTVSTMKVHRELTLNVTEKEVNISESNSISAFNCTIILCICPYASIVSVS